MNTIFTTQNFSSLNEKMLEASKAHASTAVKLSNIVLHSAERYASLNLEWGKKVIDQNLEVLRALSSARDPRSVLDISSTMAQPAIDNSFSAAKSIYEASVLTQKEIQGFLETEVTQFKTNLYDSLDKIAKANPYSENVIEVIKSSLNSASAAFNSIAQSAKKVSTELVEAGVAVASQSAKATTEAATNATKAAVNVAENVAAANKK